MSKNPGEKGRQYERDIARELSQWWTNGVNDDVFWRTDTSGGRATTRAKSGLATANAVGDMCSRTPEGELLLKAVVIEIKRGYNDLEVIPLLDKDNHKSNPLLMWWRKLMGECERVNKKPMLIFKRDRAHPCLVITRGLFDYLTDYIGDVPNWGEIGAPYIATSLDNTHVFILRLRDFFHWVRPDALKEIFLANN